MPLFGRSAIHYVINQDLLLYYTRALLAPAPIQPSHSYLSSVAARGMISADSESKGRSL